MAIAPHQLNDNFIDEVDNYEEKIDSLLTNKRISIGQSVSIVVPRGMNFQHFEAIKPRYINVGWKELNWVSFYDQRDQYDYTTIEFKS